jgi:hypothetical protein
MANLTKEQDMENRRRLKLSYWERERENLENERLVTEYRQKYNITSHIDKEREERRRLRLLNLL